MTAVATIDTSFFGHGMCVGLDPELFHPERGASTTNAKAVCGTCAVRIPCLEWALATHQSHGIWGGTAERERRRIRRRLAGGQHIPELDPDWRPTGYGGRPLVLSHPPIAISTPIPIPPNPTTRTGKELVMDLAVATTDPPTSTNGNGAAIRSTAVCANCGKPYVPKRRDQRFHSKECARVWYASHPRGEGGTRTPRVPKSKELKAVTPNRAEAPSLSPIPASTPGAALDLPQVLGQLLVACDRWAIEADIGDVRISVTKGCR